MVTGIFILVTGVLFILGLGYKPLSFQKIFNVVIFASVTIIALFHFKRKHSGFLSLGNAFMLGLGVTLVGSLLIILWVYLFSKILNSDFYFEGLREYNIWNHGLLNPHLSHEEIVADTDAALEENIRFEYLSIFIGNVVLNGLIINFIISLLMKSKKGKYKNRIEPK